MLARVSRPSPALIIALIALFVSLSGVSYGVATGFIDSREIKNNQVRSLDIRNNEIRTRDLRNNEVRGIDIRNSTVQSRDIAINAVTGEDVKEDTLQKVPSALLADNATTATTATTATSVTSLKLVPQTSVAEGQTVTLATHGPLTLLGRCSSAGADTDAELQVRTTEDNSAVGGEAPGHPDVDAGQTANAAALSTSDPVFELKAVTVYASAPSGKAFSGVIGLRADAAASSCKFEGHLALQG